ncbi:MAG: hypothetical protein PF961_08225 [Planctomycetota bacterium]|jgi:spermidine synthase|nr:hypothetical protein [Planctomycetota bacterium]
MSAESLHLWLEQTWNEQQSLRLRLRSCLHESTSPFQRIAVYDSFALGRVLALGGTITLSEADEAIYAEGLVHPALRCHSAPRRVLIIGGGDGSVCREVCRYPDVESITVVEIDQTVTEIVREYFPTLGASLDDPRVDLVIDDAHRFLSTNTDCWDIIIIDADSLHSTANHVVQPVPIGSLLEQRLAQGGILVAPLGLPAFAASTCRDQLRELAQRFATAAVYQFTTPSMIGQQWAVAWCSQERVPELIEPAPACTGELEYWAPDLQASLFALPRHRQRQLGLA